jgi:DNA replication protein DnaC
LTEDQPHIVGEEERDDPERAARLGRIHAAEDDVAALLGTLRPTLLPDAPLRCGAKVFGELLKDGEESCDRAWHFRGEGDALAAVRRCPSTMQNAQKLEIQGLIRREKLRLVDEIRLVTMYGSFGFKRYEFRCEGAKAAYKAAAEFSKGRPPRHSVLLSGPTGLGKTRLLLASHFTLLGAGVRSVYLTSPELRAALDDRRSFDEGAKERGTALVERARRAEAVHFDDLGNVDDDERKVGNFREGLKELLDRRKGAWFVATNCTFQEAETHPDIGKKVLSRLVGGVVVCMKGEDYRMAQAQERKDD